MQRSASDRALVVMTRPAVHRRSGLFGTSIGTSFNGVLGLALRAPSPSPPIPTSPILLVLADDQLRAVVSRARCCCGVATAAAVECLEPMSSCEAACAHVHTGLLLADHAPQYARCARRPLPAMARSRSSSPAAKRHSSRGNKIAQPAILRFAAGQGCGPFVAALKDRHQGRDGRGLGNSNRRSPWLRLAPSPAPKTARTPAP